MNSTRNSLRFNFWIVVSSILLFTALSGGKSKFSGSDYVNPFIGTQGSRFISVWRAEGSTYPGAVAPHGRVQISSETSAAGDFLRGYYYDSDTIRRFSLAEHFSGWPNGSGGKGLIMPFSKKSVDEISMHNARSIFSHENEKAEVGYYSVYLDENKISCEMSAKTMSGMGVFRFENAATNGIILSGFNRVEQIDAQSFVASVSAFTKIKSLHFYFEFNQPLKVISRNGETILLRENGELHEIRFKCGASYVSDENAKQNLQHEIPGWDINKVKKEAKKLWDAELNKVEVEGGDSDEMVMFYTSMYHASLLPINATDVNGQFPGFEKNAPLEDGETHYVYFAAWDSFRTFNTWLNFMNRGKNRDFLRSALRYYKAYEIMPEMEAMTGMHLISIFADALAKGITDFDIQLAYKALGELYLEKPYFKHSLEEYEELGFVPFESHAATTATLEYAFNDFGMSLIAEAAGDTETAERLKKRSFNYRNNYHPKTRFMQSKNEDGSWSEISSYGESDKWNISWFVPHNNRDLINLMGGDEAFCEHLNFNFENGHFLLDNETQLNFPYLFSYAGKPYLSMKWKNAMMRKYFFNTPDGIYGNDDWGAMSSWISWTSIGIYPVCPGVNELTITAPIFEKVRLHFENGNSLLIKAENVSPENVYIQSSTLDGKTFVRAFVQQEELWNAKELVFEMGATPNKTWGLAGETPFSLTKEKPDFELVSVQTEETEVSSGQALTLQTSIKNSGATGSYHLKVEDGKQVLHSEFVLVDENETKTVEVPLRLYAGGTKSLSIEDKTVSVEISPTKLDKNRAFEYSNLEIEPLVFFKDSLDISCEVKNISGYEMEFVPEIKIDNQTVKRFETIIIQPGETVTLSKKTAPIAELGFHSISINNSSTEKFKVYETTAQTCVLHYTFDDKNKITDHSGFENHGEIVGEVDFVEGVNGTAVRMVDGYIHIPETRSMTIEGDEITMLCWYKPGDETQVSPMISKGTYNMLNFHIGWQAKFTAGSWGRGNAVYNLPAPDENQPTEWMHFAGTRKGGDLSLFYNGNLVDVNNYVGDILHTDFAWRIGGNMQAHDRKMKGDLDEVMIFYKALSDEEIKELINKAKKQKR